MNCLMVHSMNSHSFFQRTKALRVLIIFLILTPGLCHADTRVPQTLEALWADFPARDEATPLDTEMIKTWEENDVILHLVRFNIGEFNGEMLKLVGFYAVPKGEPEKNLPALVVCHGGGQRASVGGPKNWAMNGYAAFCPNNGAQPWEKRFEGLPNTDYGSFNPGVSKPDIRDGKPDLFQNIYGEKLDDWHKVMTLQFSDGKSLARDKEVRMPRAGNKAVVSVPTDVSTWNSSYYQSTDAAFAKDNVQDKLGRVIPLRNLRWEGGTYISRPKHWEKE